MRKVITEEERTPLNEAGEMFNETGCVPGIDGEQVPAERMVLDAKEYILEANDKTSLLTFLASTLTDDGKLRFTSNEVTHRQSPQGRTRCERLQCEPARTSIRAGQSDRLPLGGLGGKTDRGRGQGCSIKPPVGKPQDVAVANSSVRIYLRPCATRCSGQS